ncbi:MAG: ATP-grasp domain-containing protein [Acidimicrobiales bacterium]
MLLLPSSTYRAADFLAAAKALGVEVIVASDHHSTLDSIMGDRSLVIDPSRPEEAARAIVELASRVSIDAAMGVDDTTVLTANLANAQMGRPHNRPEAIMATRDKARLRGAWDRAGISQPRWAQIGAGQDPGAIGDTLGWPCVVKPAGLSASRGVIRANDPDQARHAAQWAEAIAIAEGMAPGTPLIIEQFVAGPEVALEGLLRQDKLETLAIFDKPDPLDGPFFEETIYVTPSSLQADVQATISRETERAAQALGLSEGPIHAEARIGADGIRMLEIGGRSIGGLCSRTLSFGTGRSLEQVILAHALGLEFDDLDREAQASGVMMIPIAEKGTLTGVGGQDDARAVSGVVGLEISIAPGRLVTPLPEGSRYLGFIFAKGSTPAEVTHALRQAHACLEIEIDSAH